MRALAVRVGRANLVLDSAGTGDWHVGELPDPRTREAARARGIELVHRARQFVCADLERFDLILAMDRANLANLRAMVGDRAPPRSAPVPQLRSDGATRCRGARSVHRRRARASRRSSISASARPRASSPRSCRDLAGGARRGAGQRGRARRGDPRWRHLRGLSRPARGRSRRVREDERAARHVRGRGARPGVARRRRAPRARRARPRRDLARTRVARARRRGSRARSAAGSRRSTRAARRGSASIAPTSSPRLPQDNTPEPDWPTFYLERRLRPLLDARRPARAHPARRSRAAARSLRPCRSRRRGCTAIYGGATWPAAAARRRSSIRPCTAATARSISRCSRCSDRCPRADRRVRGGPAARRGLARAALAPSALSARRARRAVRRRLRRALRGHRAPAGDALAFAAFGSIANHATRTRRHGRARDHSVISIAMVDLVNAARELAERAITTARELTRGGEGIDEHQVVVERVAYAATEARVIAGSRRAAGGAGAVRADRDRRARAGHRAPARADRARAADRHRRRAGAGEGRGARCARDRGSRPDRVAARRAARRGSRERARVRRARGRAARRAHPPPRRARARAVHRARWRSSATSGCRSPRSTAATSSATSPMILTTEELSRASLAAAGSLITRPEILAKALLAGGTEAQKARWLPQARVRRDHGRDLGDRARHRLGRRVASAAAPRRVDGRLGDQRREGVVHVRRPRRRDRAARADERRPARAGLTLFIVDKPRFAGHEFAADAARRRHAHRQGRPHAGLSRHALVHARVRRLVRAGRSAGRRRRGARPRLRAPDGGLRRGPAPDRRAGLWRDAGRRSSRPPSTSPSARSSAARSATTA